MKPVFAAVTLASVGCLVNGLPATKWKRQSAGDAFAVLDPQNWVNPDNVSGNFGLSSQVILMRF
jgi:hypothetical protein